MPSSHGGGGHHGGGGFHGGGSHGGGFHGGSHHHGPHHHYYGTYYGRGSSFSRTKAIPNGTKYEYINKDGETRSFYYEGTPRKRNMIWRLVVVAAILAFSTIFFVEAYNTAPPTKLASEQCQAT